MSDIRKMLDDYNAFNSGKSDSDDRYVSSARRRIPQVKESSGECKLGCAHIAVIGLSLLGWIMFLIDQFIVDFM